MASPVLFGSVARRGQILPQPSARLSSRQSCLLGLRLRAVTRQASANGKTRSISYLAALETTQGIITTLQASTSLPWMVVIPTLTVAFTVLIRLPSQLYARRLLLRQKTLEPLKYAWTYKHRQDIADRQQSSGLPLTQADMTKLLVERSMREQKRLYKKWAVQRWKGALGFWVSLPPLLIVADTLRRMAGTSGGLLSLLANRSSDAAISPEYQSLIEPSFATGGCLWFPDLALADPYLILPVATSAIFFLRAVPKTMREFRLLIGVRGADEDMSIGSSVSARAGVAAKRLMVFVLPLLPILAFKLPSVVFVYWISSSLTGWALNIFVDKRMPVKALYDAPTRRGDKPPTSTPELGKDGS